MDRDFKLDFNIRDVTFSPDENWIIYLNDTTTSLTFYYRSRIQWSDFYSSVTLNGTAEKNRITTWSFNKKGDLLFIGTSEGFIYKCKFSPKMTNQDCLTKLSPTPKNSQVDISSISVNSEGKIACIKYGLLLLSLS